MADRSDRSDSSDIALNQIQHSSVISHNPTNTPMPEQANNPEIARVYVEALRSKLLDLSLRNRMLNYRPSRRYSISIIGEDSTHLYNLVAGDSPKKLTFVGRPDPPVRGKEIQEELPVFDDEVSQFEFKEQAEDELNAYLTDPTKPVDQLDTKLNTEEYVSVLQAKLRSIQHQAVLAREELGINTLFITLGMLEWRDQGRSEPLLAPLLFVPVQLERQKNGTLRLVQEGSDAGGNLPLQAKLKEFNIKLPDFDDEKGVKAFLDEIEASVRLRQDWKVRRNDVALGFFSYEKFSMYVDLSGDQWPEGRKPWQHPDIQNLLALGYPPVESPITNDSFVDDIRSVEHSLEVYDADQSQLIAMLRASAGLSMVVEGPPGTGKSQTITNMIAEAVASGKRVLFVAAKKAAVDVVKRRLDEAGLGAMVLDMHDKLLNRKEFYSELKRTASLALKVSDETAKVERLAELRKHLNDYCRSVNEPMQPFGISPFDAIGHLSALPKETNDDRPGRISFDDLSHLSAVQIEKAMPVIEALQERLSNVGVPDRHPFWGSRLDYFDPALKLDLEQLLPELIGNLEKATSEVEAVCIKLQIPMADTLAELKTLGDCAERIKDSPPHAGVQLALDQWEQKRTEIDKTIELLDRRRELHRVWDSSLAPNAWTANLEKTEQAYRDHAGSVLRFLHGDFRAAQRQMQALIATGVELDVLKQLTLVGAIREVQNGETAIQAQDGLMSQLFGLHWQGLATDPDRLFELQKWVLRLRGDAQAGAIPNGLISFLQGANDAKAAVPEIAAAISQVRKALDSYTKTSALIKYPTGNLGNEEWGSILGRVSSWQENLDRLPDMIAYQEVRTKLADLGVEAAGRTADTWPLAATKLKEAFLRSYYTGVFREAANKRPSIKVFDRAVQDKMIAEFQALDDFKLKYNRAKVRQLHLVNLPDLALAAGNLQLLRVQCELQRRHKPIRWTMEHAGEAVQRIKPVFMMSPLTVALHLPPELPPFDLVIFDEASQIKPEDALCAIIRAMQAVVVGDTRQLPPTSFFDRIAGDETEEDEAVDEASIASIETKKLESLLELMSASANGTSRRPSLRWHYRSIHPALIQPSNDMFYDNRLVVFPSPTAEQDGKRIGVVFHHSPETVYEPGSSKRFNKKEAELVADAVLRHLIESPELSLMVAAMNRSQADLIEDEIEKRERLAPELFAEFEKKHPFEPLRVRNLENVQGDERDVIFISVTYGRDAKGVIRQQFGPLLKEGGERRLNVLITRARQRCEVFSNMVSEDLRLDNPCQGLTALKKYLAFAEKGSLNGGFDLHEHTPAPFEDQVAEALNARGYQTAQGVGCEGYRIDIAIKDPSNDDAFILGIECDGPTYNSARAARDRDKLRQRVLELRGWNLCRIWSRDWWQNRDGEIQRVAEMIEALKKNPDAVENDDPPTDSGGPVVTQVERRPDVEVVPYPEVIQGPPIETEEGMLVYIARTVQIEGPISFSLLENRIKAASGKTRSGSRLQPWIAGLLQRAEFTQTIARHGDAYYRSPDQLESIRDWSALPVADKKPAFITNSELSNALYCVVKSSFGIAPADAVKKAYGLLGFKRLTEAAQARGAKAIQNMSAAGDFIERDGLLHLAYSI